jgi:hypothetical protein
MRKCLDITLVLEMDTFHGISAELVLILPLVDLGEDLHDMKNRYF